MAEDINDFEAVGVSPDMHEWTFEQALSVSQQIDSDDRTFIHWLVPEGRLSSISLRDLSKQTEQKISLILQTALIHGFAICKNKHSELITMLEALDSAAANNANKTYLTNLKYASNVGTQMKRVCVAIELGMSDEMGQVAFLLGTSKQQLATVSIMYSLCTSDLFNEHTKQIFQEHLTKFEVGLAIFQAVALHLS